MLNSLKFLSELDYQLGENPKVLCGIGTELISWNELTPKDESEFAPLRLDKLKKIPKVMISFHGYGERAETQVCRMQELKVPNTILWICPQALHPFPIKSRQERTDILEVDKIAWSWMAKKTRDRDISWNREYMMAIYGVLRNIFRLSEKAGQTSGFHKMPMGQANPSLTILGHSQGASQAWRTASWIPCKELIIHAGDIPPELRKQWPIQMKINLEKIVLGRAQGDKVLRPEIFERDKKIVENFLDANTIWGGRGTHAWEGEWVEYLRQHLIT